MSAEEAQEELTAAKAAHQDTIAVFQQAAGAHAADPAHPDLEAAYLAAEAGKDTASDRVEQAYAALRSLRHEDPLAGLEATNVRLRDDGEVVATCPVTQREFRLGISMDKASTLRVSDGSFSCQHCHASHSATIDLRPHA